MTYTRVNTNKSLLLIANSTAAHGSHLVSEGGQSLWLNNQYRSVEAYSYTSAVASPQSENKDISGSVQMLIY